MIEAIGAAEAIGVLEAIAGNDPLPSGLKSGHRPRFEKFAAVSGRALLPGPLTPGTQLFEYLFVSQDTITPFGVARPTGFPGRCNETSFGPSGG